MIIDCHTHIFDPDRDLAQHARDDMTRCGIDLAQWRNLAERHIDATKAADAAVVFGLRAKATGWQVPNDSVAAHVRREPQRLIGFGSVDPAEPGYMDELERCHCELEFQGIKLSPVYQGVHPLDKRYDSVYSYCCQHGLVIMIHMATTFSSGTPLDFARPVYMDEVAARYPDLKIVLPHMGHPWEGETIAAIRRNPNLYADISALYYRPWQFYNSMRLLTEYRADSKVLFGSDFPFTTTGDSIEGLKNVNTVLGSSGLPAVPDDVISGILHRDALTLLGLRLKSMPPKSNPPSLKADSEPNRRNLS